MVFPRLGSAALLVVFLSACSMFESQSTRNEKRYERYIQKSRQAKVRRQNKIAKQEEAAIPSAPVQQQQQVQTGDQAMPAPLSPGGGMPVQPPPDTATAPFNAAPAPSP